MRISPSVPRQGVVFLRTIAQNNIARETASGGVGLQLTRDTLFKMEAAAVASASANANASANTNANANATIAVDIGNVNSFQLVFNSSVGNRFKLAGNKPSSLQVFIEFTQNGADLRQMPTEEQRDCFARVELTDVLDSDNRPLMLPDNWFLSDLSTKIAQVNGKWMIRISGQSILLPLHMSYSAIVVTFYYLNGRRSSSSNQNVQRRSLVNLQAQTMLISMDYVTSGR